MKEKLYLNYLKPVFLVDLIKEVMDKIIALLIIAVITFTVFFCYNYKSCLVVENEKPCFTSTMDIYVTADFKNDSILKVADRIFSEATIESILSYEGLEYESGDVLKAITYSAESKYILRVQVYGKDKKSTKRIMQGINDIVAPMIEENTNASKIICDTVADSKLVKVYGINNIGGTGPIDVTNCTVTEWENYVYLNSTTRLIKSSIIVTAYVEFVIIMLIILRKILSRKIENPCDVESSVKISISAATTKKLDGTDYVAQTIINNNKSLDEILLLSILKSDKTFELMNKVACNLGKNSLEIIDMESSSEYLNYVEEKRKVILFCESMKVTDLQLINTVNNLYDCGIFDIQIVLTNVDDRIVKRRKEYFGKFYPNAGE